MKISIFGLGYVGSVTAGCLAEFGHNIIGVDVNKEKVNLINEGRSPVIEEDLENLIRKNVKENRLKATNKTNEAVLQSEITIICVGTPSSSNGNIDLNAIKRVSEEIGKSLLSKKGYHIIINRSTVIPGTTKSVIKPLIEKYSKKKVGDEFGVVSNPEFLRETSAVRDFINPPSTVIGGTNLKDSHKVASIYKNINAPLIYTSIEVAEMIKYANNAFHALKIAFANEIGLICKKLSIDSHKVMEILCLDKKLNISEKYLMPGFAFGGSCLPKDLRAINYFGRHNDLEIPLLNSISISNRIMIEYALQLIEKMNKKNVGILGFAFKAGTDDLRESPIVTLIELLLGKGYNIQIYDKSVSLSLLKGANKRFIEEKIPHIATLIKNDIKEIISFAEILVIGNKNEEFANALQCINKKKYILDLVKISGKIKKKSYYEGICW